MSKQIEIEITLKKALLGVLIFVVGLGWLYRSELFSVYRKINPQKKSEVRTQLSIQEHAEALVKKCADKAYKPTCYEQEVPRLMPALSMNEAFEVTRRIQALDSQYPYCHVLGHKLSAIETAKDLSKWKEVIAMCPSGLCSNGCIHGAFQERFRREHLTDAEIEDLKPELSGVCEARPGFNPTGLEKGTCYHALGHLSMYITQGEIGKSLDLCDQLLKDVANGGVKQLCYDGAFMQIFQPLENEDFALVEGKQPSKQGLKAYCDKFTGLRRGPCWSEGWPLYRDEILTSSGVNEFCGQKFLTDAQDIRRCFNGLFYVVTAQKNFDTDFLKGYCSGLPDTVSGQCFANVASRLIETDYRQTDKSVGFCELAVRQKDRSACYDELLMYAGYNFHKGSAENLHLCQILPEPWKEKCLK